MSKYVMGVDFAHPEPDNTPLPDKIDQILGHIVYPMVGPRCKTKDTADFPELTDEHTGGRCLVCTTYEEIDKAKTALTKLLLEAKEEAYREGVRTAIRTHNEQYHPELKQQLKDSV